MVFEAHGIRFLTVPVSECYTLEQILLSVLITAVCIKNVGWYSKHNPTLCKEYQPQFTRPYFFFFFLCSLSTLRGTRSCHLFVQMEKWWMSFLEHKLSLAKVPLKVFARLPWNEIRQHFKLDYFSKFWSINRRLRSILFSERKRHWCWCCDLNWTTVWGVCLCCLCLCCSFKLVF